MFAPLSGFLWVFYLRQKKTPRVVHETIPGLSLHLSHSGGIAETLTLPAGRIRCGFSPDYDIDLTNYIKAGRTTGKAPTEELTFQLADGRLAITAHSKVMMNGVERTSGSIPVNGSLLFKTCRFTFLGQAELHKERNVYPGTATLRKLAAAPVAASMAALMLLVFGLVDLGASGYFKRFAPRPSVLVEQRVEAVPPTATVPEPAQAPEKKPVVVPLRSAVRPEPIKPVPERRTDPVAVSPEPAPAPVRSPVVVPLRSAVRPEPIKPVPERRAAPMAVGPAPAPAAEQATPVRQPLPGAEIAAAISPRAESRPELEPEPKPSPGSVPRLLPTAPYPSPRMVIPGEPIPDERVDVLFIHAHPDDESIDYGALMVLCKEAGLRTATVLLTDGEGGIYQQDYTGPRDNIVSTRVVEAARAMQFLGSSLYIRLGLQNNPYNSLLEEKGVQEVLRLWDADTVVARLADIISTLGPKVVVSPEGPSFAREHFEHETTGVLTLMALQHLRLTGGHVPEAHLVSIDPRQKDSYAGLIAFPRQRVKERQRQALLSHATQADASCFGVQIIEKYSEEYYLIQYWDLAFHFTRFFGLVSVRSSPAPGQDRAFAAFGTAYKQAP
ncbi:MAG: PIG-L family deacetylase [Spirochaetota bacterium]